MPVNIADLLERYHRDGDSLALARALSIIESAWLGECVADLAVDRPLPEAVGALLEEAARRWRT